LVHDGLAPGELERTQARIATHLLRDTDAVLGRALPMAVLELQRGRPELLNELPKLVGEVTEAQIVTAAAALRPDRRATVAVLPGATQRPPRSCPTWCRTPSSSSPGRPSARCP